MKVFDIKLVWIAVPIIAISSLFGESCCVPQPACKPKTCCPPAPPCIQLPAAYIAPAGIEVNCGWDFLVVGTFTYWQPLQDNMEYAVVSESLDLLALGFDYQKTEMGFKPGFKVGLGMNFDKDDWDSLLQYTWFRGNQRTSTSIDPASDHGVVSLWASPSSTQLFTSASMVWQVQMDLLDYELGRSGHYGKDLTIRPFFGARAAWIRQKGEAFYFSSRDLNSLLEDQSTKSWGIGPRMGLQTNWMIGEGVRFFGNGSGDILFTRYTGLNGYSETFTAGVISSRGDVTERNLNTLRAHLDMDLGFGWGTYFDCNNWHVDFALGYGFQVFFSQNMFRHYEEAGALHATVANGNLYVQGLNFSARLDF